MYRLLLLGTLAILASSPTPPAPSTNYPALKARIAEQRVDLAARHAAADATGKAVVVQEAREHLLQVLADSVFPAWYGTPWDFNGTTRTPGQGKIACGYFVTTVLQDLGFVLPRVKWAQLAAEPMIRRMAPHARSFSNATPETIERWVRDQGAGLYAAGLDAHVGFVLVRADSVRFIHSGMVRAEEGVVSEALDAPLNPFAWSRYRVVGRLLDDAMITAWLEGRSLE